MKSDVQLAFNMNAITQRELIIVDEKRISIKYHFLYFEKNQEHFIKQYVHKIINRLYQFREYIKCYFRITINYSEYNIVYIVLITIKKKLDNKIYQDLLLKASWHEKRRRFIIRMITKRFHALTNIAVLNILFYVFQHSESIEFFF